MSKARVLHWRRTPLRSRERLLHALRPGTKRSLCNLPMGPNVETLFYGRCANCLHLAARDFRGVPWTEPKWIDGKPSEVTVEQNHAD